MHPLAVHAVELVLRHISPLAGPLPPHLVSAPLRQRHHFLHISPASPAEYLCWPSADSATIIDLLDRLPSHPDRASYPTCYTSDPESTFAHVQISSAAEGLRMLFHWDHIHGWMYHDLRLMPFPSPSFSTPQESLTSCSARGPSAIPPHLSSPDLTAESRAGSAGDDSYWDAYATVAHSLACPVLPPGTSQPDDGGGEDAYWAQYASVQGSADSTVPSPLPTNRKLRPANPDDDESVFTSPPRQDQVIDVPSDVIRSRPLTSGIGPPSPNTLAHLLGALSPRKDTHSPIFDASQSPSACSLDPLSEHTATDSELVTPPLSSGYPDASVLSPIAVKANGVPLSGSRPCTLDGAEDKALSDSIKGLYCLWKAGRKGDPDGKDRNGFLRIVQAAIACD